ncbi:hypothetical protein KTAU_18700 [Thermogemmatispora aurantia]|jgi:hypothetical protein|uniref:Uncharacterized protein n=1 Tax=Thermogemmatispora aurantia TaxID=2045279 RepID=A0A5J4K6R8_9CHLR|nr:hypothetical protein [Thermogemmatispora aurantia]GER83233.1 hypothetical protein KTAU_18700 [Thermogemmatispora aurantia]
MSILESIQHGLEKAAQQAARLARIQHLQIVLNDLSYKASLEHRTLSNKVMELYCSGRLSQSELLPLCQNLATLEQHIQEIQQELERLHGEGQEQASAPPAAASGPLPAQPSASGAAAPPAAYPAYPPSFPPVAAYPAGGPIAYPPPFAMPMPTGPALSPGYAPPGYVPPLTGSPAVTATPTSDGTTVVVPPPAPESTSTAASGPDPATATAPAGVQQEAVSTAAGTGEPPTPPADVPPLGALPESALAANPEEASRRGAPLGEPGQP